MNSRPPRPPPAALPTPIDMDQRPGASSARCLDSEGLAGADCRGGCPCLGAAGCCALEAKNSQKILICCRFSINGNNSSNVAGNNPLPVKHPIRKCKGLHLNVAESLSGVMEVETHKNYELFLSKINYFSHHKFAYLPVCFARK